MKNKFQFFFSSYFGKDEGKKRELDGEKKNHARKYYNLRKRKKLRWRKRKLKRMIYLPSYFRYSPNNFYMGTGGGGGGGGGG